MIKLNTSAGHKAFTRSNRVSENPNLSDDITTMKKIVLISCVSRKGKTKAKARDLYKGPLFTYSLAYGESLKPDNIFILSAHYHLLDLDKEIEPYDVTLSYVSPDQRRKKPNLKVLTKNEARLWGEEVIKQLKHVADLDNDEFIILAGQSYINPIANSLKNFKEPLKGVKQGNRPNKLKELILGTNGK